MHPWLKPHPYHGIAVTFLLFFVLMMGFPFQQFQLLKVCRQLEPTVDLDYEACAKRSDVQSVSASWSLLFSLSQDIPGFFVMIVIGYFIDKTGHKTALKVGMISILISSATIFMTAMFSQIPLDVYVVVSVINGLSGGIPLSMMAASAYIAGTTRAEERSRYFMLKETAMSITMAIGPVFSGFVAKAAGFTAIFGLMFACSILLTFYIYFIFPDSDHTVADTGNTPTEEHLEVNGANNNYAASEKTVKEIFEESLSSTYFVITHLFSHTTSASLLIISLIFSVSASAFEVMFTFYPAIAFGWDSLDLGKFISFTAIQRITILTLGQPLIERVFRGGSNSSNDKLVGELRLLRFSLFMAIISVAGYGFARNANQFWAASMIGSIKVVADPTMQALLSIMMPVSMQGRLFGGIRLFSSIAMLMSTVLMNKFFRATVEVAPNAVFFVVMGLDVLAFLVAFFGIQKSGILTMRIRSGVIDGDAVVETRMTEETPLLA
ncbi:hypothetical protein HK100_007975 [Physocladia obscura]|uniref:Major facilitator superfamily (MFS) profile domain-containing protein n=1 Tax=Physocladia obscura TaxID=109957 RepID=A0AAD5T505_9FUNG|nr:hypothetical protein HK100_007975 [Physocladia obscura]